MIAAIPTTYRHVRFRSRLEARWAAFFDLIELRWEYEPIDYAGWIPDFRVHPREGRPVLVEIKPIIAPARDVIEKMERAAPVGARSEHGGLWLLGSRLNETSLDYDHSIGLGWSVHRWAIDDIVALISSENELHLWLYRPVTGEFVDGPLIKTKCPSGFGAPLLLEEYWATAGNTVQWKPS